MFRSHKQPVWVVPEHQQQPAYQGLIPSSAPIGAGTVGHPSCVSLKGHSQYSGGCVHCHNFWEKQIDDVIQTYQLLHQKPTQANTCGNRVSTGRFSIPAGTEECVGAVTQALSEKKNLTCWGSRHLCERHDAHPPRSNLT